MLTGELDSADVCLHHGPFRASALVVDGMRCKYCWPEQGKLNHCGLEWMRHHYSVCISWAGRHFCLRVTREKRTSFAFSWSSVTARPWIVTMCVCVLARLQSCSNPLTLRACVCVCLGLQDDWSGFMFACEKGHLELAQYFDTIGAGDVKQCSKVSCPHFD